MSWTQSNHERRRLGFFFLTVSRDYFLCLDLLSLSASGPDSFTVEFIVPFMTGEPEWAVIHDAPSTVLHSHDEVLLFVCFLLLRKFVGFLPKKLNFYLICGRCLCVWVLCKLELRSMSLLLCLVLLLILGSYSFTCSFFMLYFDAVWILLLLWCCWSF